MKAGKIILKWMLITMIAFTTFNLFISSDYKFEKSIEIESPIDTVYNQVADLHNWPNWAVWWQQDTSMSTEYSGAEKGIGSRMDWVGTNGDVGGLEIVSCSKKEGIEIRLHLGSMNPSGFFKFEEMDGGTKVTWKMKGEMPFFIRFITLFMDKMAGPDLEEGLKNLKEVCEK